MKSVTFHPLRLAVLLTGAAILSSIPAFSQNVFSSGSTGADGALTFATGSGLHVIDMNAKVDGVWNYTTIDIPTGVTIRFQKNAGNTPVVWLATGNVNILGEIDLDGTAGINNVNPGNEVPGGPAGFAGGLGGKRFDVSGSYAGTPGQGPGGGLPGISNNQCVAGAGHNGGGGIVCSSCVVQGAAYGNRLLSPLIGGSGGGGSGSRDSSDGYNGGGGGGAILIASSGNIQVDGSIHATGGLGYVSAGGGGSGGAIRLAANRIMGGGSLTANGGGQGQCSIGAAGFIRTEAFFVNLTQNPSPINSAGPPLATNIGAEGQVRIARIAGQVVQNPTGNLNSPDVVFTAAGNINVDLETTNVPVGTTLTVRITAPGQVIIVQSTPTDGAGEATATATVPAGVGTIQAVAEYIPES